MSKPLFLPNFTNTCAVPSTHARSASKTTSVELRQPSSSTSLPYYCAINEVMRLFLSNVFFLLLRLFCLHFAKHTCALHEVRGKCTKNKVKIRFWGCFASPSPWGRVGVGLLFFLFLFASCTGLFMDEQKSNTAKNNFNLLWKIIDERYCFFEEKEVDWNRVYDQYWRELTDYGCVYDARNQTQCLFNTMYNMLEELRDGHISLSDGSMTRTYNGWHRYYPENLNLSLVNACIRNDKQTKYLNNETSLSILPESIGYLRCPSFSDKFNRVDLDQALARFQGFKGVIIDVRSNGGGLVSEAYLLASRFARERTLVGYVRYKTGKGHNDFSDFFARYVEPDGAYPFHGKVVVITNRKIYSAANLFVSMMKNLPQVCVIGDITGGGGGVPISAELYNGWTVQLSTNPVFDTQKRSIEDGVEPHYPVSLNTKDTSKDDIIEAAKTWILAN